MGGRSKTTSLVITVYNILGQEIEQIFKGKKEAGAYIINWEPKSLSSGAYIVVLQTSNQIRTSKIAYLK